MESVLPRPRRLQVPLPARLRGAGRLRSAGRVRRRALLIAALAAAALGGGFMLFRSSSFVAVDQVEIAGVHGAQAAAVSQALEAAARQMSTMDYSAGALEAAVARYPVVRSVSVRTSFPHRMWIAVAEQLPVAQLSLDGQRSAVAADGVVLGPALASSALPTIPASSIPAVGGHVGGGRLRSYLAVLGAAPASLLPLVSRIFVGAQGLTARMSDGLLVYFGDAQRPHAKWDSLVTVLDSTGAAGASYVDVRVPQRPGAGVTSGGTGSGEPGQVSASDPTSAALAASLGRAVNGEPVVAGATEPEPPASAAAGSEPSTAGASATEAPAGETPPAEGGEATAGAAEGQTAEGMQGSVEGG